MPKTIRVKQGDTLNAISKQHGFSNFRQAGVTSVPSGNFDLIRPGDEISMGNYNASNPETIKMSAPVVSSTDRRGEFTSLSKDINNRDTPTPPPAAASTRGKKGKEAPAPAPAAQTTGDAVTDNMMMNRQRNIDSGVKWADEQRNQISSLLPQTLRAIDSQYSSSMDNISATYERLINSQLKINEVDLGRVKAYGVQNGGQYMPLEFTSAVSSAETKHAGEIGQLESERNGLIARAKAARDEGRVGAMRNNVEDLRKVESAMRERVDALQKEVQTRFEITEKVRSRKEAERLDAVNKAMKRAAFSYLGDFDKANGDPAAIDKIINGIIKDSGGLLSSNDYYDIYSSMQSSSQAGKDTAMKNMKDEQSLRKGEVDIRRGELDMDNTRNTMFNRNRSTESLINSRNKDKDDEEKNVFADLNEAFDSMNDDGNPIVGDDGFANPTEFATLMKFAKEDKITRAAFLAEYGNLINPASDRIGDYKLTKAEVDKILNIK